MKTKNKIVSLRTCLYSNKQFEKDQLIRLVKVNGKLTIDLNKNLPGRGCWLHLSQEAIDDPKLMQILSKRARCSASLELIEELKVLWQKIK